MLSTAPFRLLLAGIGLACVSAQARDGLPAYDYGVGGRTEIPLPTGVSVAVHAAAVDPQGRMLVVGRRGVRGFALRVNSDGVLDSSFGTDGWFVMPDLALLGFPAGTVTQFIAVSDSALGVYMAGYPVGADRTCALVVALNESGELRAGFGTSGSGALCGPSGLPPSISQPLSRFARLGLTVNPNRIAVLVVRTEHTTPNPAAEWVYGLTLTGAPLTSFGEQGLLTLPGDFRATGLTEDTQGRLLISGYSGSGFAFMRLLPTNLVDPAFGTGGIATIPYPTFGVSPESMRAWVMLDDRPTVGFRNYTDFTYTLPNNYGFMRATASGIADASVAAIPAAANAGYVAHQTLGPEVVGRGDTDQASDRFDRVVVAGPELVRMLSDGQLDLAFGSNGYVDLPQPPSSETGPRFSQAVAVDDAGNIHVVTSEQDASSGTPVQGSLHVLKYGGDTLFDDGLEQLH